METLGIKITLTSLNHVIKTMKGKSGNETRCLIIPIKNNNLFESDKGNIYLDLIAFPLKNSNEYGDTHLLKQSLSKEIRESLTDEEKNKLPIFGNVKELNISKEPEPKVDNNLDSDIDDLPF